MALDFTDGSSDLLDCGSASVLDDLSAFTYWVWFKANGTPATQGTGPVFLQKLGKILQWGYINDIYAGEFDFVGLTIDRTGVDATAFTGDLGLRFGAWTFIAGTYDASDGPRVFVGTLTSLAAEPVDTLIAAGSGSIVSDASGSLLVGGDGSSFGANGRIACAGVIAKRLSRGELIQLQYHPQPTVETKAFFQLQYDPGGTQPDLSGNGNNGSPTGLTYADHVPLGNAFGADESRVPLVLRRRRGGSPIYY